MVLRSAFSLTIALLVAGVSQPARGEEPQAADGPLPLKPDAVAHRHFKDRDKNADGKLSEEEFVQAASEADQPLVKRDFHLLDFDRDGVMSLEEFRKVPYLVPREERGQLPDPVARLARKHFEDSQEAWKNFDDDGDGQLDQKEFRAAAAELLHPRETALRRAKTDWPFLDRDGSGRASREEWKRYLEVSYGVRRPQGELLRAPSGILINWMYYKFSDRDRNDRIDHTEFIRFGFDGEQGENRFTEMDKNADGVVAFAEWSGHDSRLIDLFWQFRILDTTLDARLDREELLKNIPDWQKSIATYMFPGFDTDRDGFLSLDEFALTPLYDQFIEWHGTRLDRNADGQLDFSEFQFDQEPAVLELTAEYFRRLDVDESGTLEHDEWLFHTPEPPQSRLFVMNADGTGVELLADVGLFDATYLGSPDWSHDGKALVFDATPARGLHSDFSRSLIVRMAMAGPDQGKAVKLGFGNCPDWSPDGKRIAFFVNGGNPDNDDPGVWIMNADGTGREFIGGGLSSPRWSPDGRSLLCANTFSSPKSFALVDVKTGQRKTVLDKVTGWGVPDWDPGGNLVCLTLRLGDRRALCLVNLAGDPDSIIELWSGEMGREQLARSYDNSRPNWLGNGREILFTDNSTGASMLKRVATTGDEAPVVINPALHHGDVNAVWSADGKRIVFCSTQSLADVPGLKRPATEKRK